MSAPHNLLRATILGLLLLHLLAAFAAPGPLWGVSHLAVWPTWFTLAWSGTAIAVCLLPIRPRPDFPGRRGALGLAAAAGCLFWVLRERTHYFGDGYLLIHDRGFSETVTRAPLLVESTARIVRSAEASLHWPPERTLALLAVAAGGVAVYALLRLSAHLTPNPAGRWLCAALLATAGSMQLFCGHVEYYAAVGAAVLVYLALVVPVLAAPNRGNAPLRDMAPQHSSAPPGDNAPRHGSASHRDHRATPDIAPRSVWTALLAYAGLVPLHLSALGLGPAHLYLCWHVWRGGRRGAAILTLPAVAVIAAGLTRVAGGKPGALATFSLTGIGRYTAPYFDASTARHAFGLFSPAHFLAVGNDLLLGALLVLLALPAAWLGRRTSLAPHERFLAIAGLGCLGVNFLFSRELGPYRDWDILAPYGFVLLAWTAVLLLRSPVDPVRATVLVLAAGLHHTVPWLLTNATPRLALAHLQLVLDTPSQWSPGARANMHETLAIQAREHGDEPAAFREYEAAVQANPADARHHVGLGNLYAGRGEMERAAREYATALESRPEYAPAHNNLAFALASQQTDLDRAREHARTALRIEPQNPDYWLTLARVELAANQVAAARQALQQALLYRRPFPVAEKLLDSLPP
jgi:tetratricopeptide (TPR) repeat protein